MKIIEYLYRHFGFFPYVFVWMLNIWNTCCSELSSSEQILFGKMPAVGEALPARRCRSSRGVWIQGRLGRSWCLVLGQPPGESNKTN